MNEPNLAAPPGSIQIAPVAAERGVSYAGWLRLTEIAIVLHLLASLVLIWIGSKVFYERLTTPCAQAPCYQLQLSPAEIAVLENAGLSVSIYAAYQISLELTYLLAYLVIGGVIYWRLVWQRTPKAWMGLVAAFTLISIGSILLPNTAWAVTWLGPGWHPFYALLKGSSLLVFYVFLLTFPDGCFKPGWTRWMLPFAALWQIAWLVSPYRELDSAGSVGIFISLGLLVFCVSVQVYRYRKISNHIQRQQAKWVVSGFAMMLVAVALWTIFFIVMPLEPGPGRLLFNLFGQAFLSSLPVIIAGMIAISILNYRLWDIDVLINRTLVYATLTVIIISLYTLLVGGLSVVLQTSGNFFVALSVTAIIALVFQPLRDRLQNGVNRLMFGARDDPAMVMAQLGRQLEVVSEPEAVLPAMLQTIAGMLKLPFVSIELRVGDQFELAAETGQLRQLPTQSYPLIYQAETIGRLVVALRSPGEPLSEADERVLRQVAAQAGTAVHAARLTQDLRRSRTRIVTAREEERQRIQRDLHDGLGPVLASHGLKLAAARQLLRTEPEIAETLLDEVIERNQNTVSELRHLVYNLRPPVIDSLGLIEALREYIQSPHGELLSLGGQRLQIHIPPEGLPKLNAATEVAAYRIILEALNNVQRHSQAQHCKVVFEIQANELVLEVADDGKGFTQGRAGSIGLTSMRERAEELGGRFEIASEPGLGTKISAWLPLK